MFEAAILAQKYFTKHANGRKTINVLVSVAHKMCVEYTKTIPKASESFAFKVSESAGSEPIVEVAA